MKEMKKIRDILYEYRERGIPFEVWYSPRKRRNPERNIGIGDADGYYDNGEILRPEIPMEDLWAYDYAEYDADLYEQEVSFIEDMTWDEYADGNGSILVIWLSRKSYRLLSDPEIKQISQIRLDYIGQYHEVVAVRIPKPAKPVRDDDIDDINDLYDEYDDSYRLQSAEIVSLPRNLMDQRWAESYYLVGQNDMDSLPFRLELKWLDEESFEEHYGNPNAHILVVVLV